MIVSYFVLMALITGMNTDFEKKEKQEKKENRFHCLREARKLFHSALILTTTL